MPTSCHQVPAVASQEPDRELLWDQRAASSGEDPQGSCTLAENLTMEYDRPTDVMHVDICFPSSAARVDVIDVGDCVGFPGQIVARVDLERKIMYGITIQNFSGFRRKLFWRYRMASIQRALQFMLNVLLAALWIQNDHPARLQA